MIGPDVASWQCHRLAQRRESIFTAAESHKIIPVEQVERRAAANTHKEPTAKPWLLFDGESSCPDKGGKHFMPSFCQPYFDQPIWASKTSEQDERLKLWT
jgi:hypothetical protein